MRRRIDRCEQGQVLLLALGFVTFVGIIGLALGSYVTTSVRASTKLRDTRSLEFAADGVVDTAINKVRTDPAAATAGCLQPGTVPLNGQSLRVDCATGADAHAVTFTVCTQDAVTTGCPGEAVLIASVLYGDPINGAPRSIDVTGWSVRR
jgi:Tfp pilus assembly protein PilX